MHLKQEKESQINPLDYFLEQGYQVVNFSYGWATYEIIDKTCYIKDMYISKENRRNGCGTNMANVISKKAKKAGCDTLTTTINTSGKIDVTRSMKSILSYGFEFADSFDGYLLFKKAIK